MCYLKANNSVADRLLLELVAIVIFLLLDSSLITYLGTFATLISLNFCLRSYHIAIFFYCHPQKGLNNLLM